MSDASTTTIALALGMLRSLARQAATGTHVLSAQGKDAILDLLAQQVGTADGALAALEEVERRLLSYSTVNPPYGGVIVGEAVKLLVGDNLAVDERGCIRLARPGEPVIARMIEDSIGAPVIYIEFATGRAANTEEALRRMEEHLDA